MVERRREDVAGVCRIFSCAFVVTNCVVPTVSMFRVAIRTLLSTLEELCDKRRIDTFSYALCYCGGIMTRRSRLD